MKGNLLKFAPLCLLLCWMLPVDSMTIRYNLTLRDANHDVQSFPLNMAEDSVDDMYFGCMDATMKIVKKKYLVSESRREPFGKIWKECGKKKRAHRKDEALTKDHIQAICAYTSNGIYAVFNDAVRTGGSMYTSSSFHFHSLHFLLTSAVSILNSNYKCHTTYRRTRDIFTGRVGQWIRFGSFTSSSYKHNLTDFGSKTCFKIKTCSGAPVKNYSEIEDEDEVLIPPYEVFSIAKRLDGRHKIPDLKDCEVVYILESKGVKSKLNCKLVSPQESSGFSLSGVSNHSAIFKPSDSVVRN